MNELEEISDSASAQNVFHGHPAEIKKRVRIIILVLLTGTLCLCFSQKPPGSLKHFPRNLQCLRSLNFSSRRDFLLKMYLTFVLVSLEKNPRVAFSFFFLEFITAAEVRPLWMEMADRCTAVIYMCQSVVTYLAH